MEANRDKPFFLNYWQFSVHAPFDAKQSLIDRYRKTVDPDDTQQCPTYAAMVHSLDENVGKVLDAIDALVPPGSVVDSASDRGWLPPWLADPARRRRA